MPWNFSFYWMDHGACKIIDSTNCFADQDSSNFEKTLLWDTATLYNARKPFFPPEDAVLQVSMTTLDYNHSILQQALYPLMAPLGDDQPKQFAPQATLSFRLCDPLPIEIAPYVKESDILDLLTYDKQFVNHTAFAVPNPKSAQAVKNFLMK